MAEVTTVQYFFRQILQNALDAVQYRQPAVVGDLHAFQPRELFHIVQIRTQLADGFNGAAAMRGLDGHCRIDAARFGPCLPRALDRADGADQHAIHIEENATRMESDHVCRGCCVHIFRLAGRATRSRMQRGVQKEITEVAPGEIIRTGHCAMIRKRSSGCPALHGRAGWVCLSCN